MEFNCCMGCMKEYGGEGACPHCGFDISEYEPALHHLTPGTILNGKYILGKVLGEGGFGISYLGWDLNLNHKVAIKEFYPSSYVTRQAMYTPEVTMLTGNHQEFYQKGLDKFIEEARVLAKFSGLQGIVQVRDYFQENGTAYIVMEFAEGQTLKKVLDNSGGRLPADQVFEMMRPVIESLSEVHKKGLIHRDISPDNMIADADGNVKLLDFGAARNYISEEEKSLSVVLKPGYTPEEQYRSRGEQGPWTDVYALCATMYRAITGERPTESLDRLNKDDLRKPSSYGIVIEEQQEAVLMKGLAIDKKDRFDSMEELQNALYQGNTNIILPTGTTSSLKLHSKKWIFGVLCAAVAIAVLCVAGLRGGKAEPQKEEDEQESMETAEDTDTKTETDAVLTEADYRSMTKAQWETWSGEDGTKYEGFKNENNRPDGEARITFASGDQYEGYCVNGVYRWHGKYTWADAGWYEGGWNAGKRSGFGILYLEESGQTYKGQWSNGERNGLGIVYEKDGTYTVSTWKDGKKVKDLEASLSKKNLYTSNDEEFSDQAVLIYESGTVYIGEVSEEKPEGWGCCFFVDGNTNYIEGGYSDGNYEGIEAIYNRDGGYTIAYYSKGDRNGPSIQVDPDGRIFEAFYKDWKVVRRWINVSGEDGSVVTGIPREDQQLKTDREAETWFEGDMMYIGRRENGKIKGDYVDFHTDGRHCLRNSEDDFYAQFCGFYNNDTSAYFGWDPSDYIEGWKKGERLYVYLQEDGRIGLGNYEDGEWIPYKP